METEKKIENKDPEGLFKAGAHFGFTKSRRHPSVKELIFGVKNKVDIFDLLKTSEYLERASAFVEELAKKKQQILFAGSKNPALRAIKTGAEEIGMPFVSGRWIGGTLTNFKQIRKRIERMESLVSQREKGELSKYTKREQLMIDREIEGLERFFGGLILMKELPKALFIIDSRREKTAVREAQALNIPIVSLSGSDSNIKEVDYPIPANDSSITSIEFFVKKIVEAYKAGSKAAASQQTAAVKE